MDPKWKKWLVNKKGKIRESTARFIVSIFFSSPMAECDSTCLPLSGDFLRRLEQLGVRLTLQLRLMGRCVIVVVGLRGFIVVI